MQIVENWSDVYGKVVSVEPSAVSSQHRLATVKVERVEPVGSYANLADQDVGREIKVHVPEVALQHVDLTPNKRIRLRVRRAGIDKYFSHPEGVTELQNEANGC